MARDYRSDDPPATTNDPAEPAPVARDTAAEPYPTADRRRGAQARARYGGFDWVATFLGFVVATFFTTVFLAIVGAIVGSVGFQLGARVTRDGVGGPTVALGAGAVIGSVVAVFLAYVIGGYTAGRLARFEGVLNGLGVVMWTVIVAIILAIIGAILGNRFNLGAQLHLNINVRDVSVAGVISLLVTLAVMVLGGMLGGLLGGHYQAKVSREMGEPTY